MSTNIIDKENSAGLFHAHTTNPRKFGDSIGGSNFTKTSLLSTPQHKLKSSFNLDLKSKSIHKLKDGNATEKRRALGDLLNTTKSTNRQSLVFNSATPKSNSISSKLSTPINKCMKQLTNDFERQSIGSAMKSDREIEQENYDPVEKCIPQIDTFDNLFEDGKLSELFLNKNITCVPRLPTTSGRIGEEDVDEFHGFNIYTDKSWDKEIKQMNKSIKAQQKKENNDCLDNFQEMPVLDLPPILEDFDLSSDSFLDD